VLRGGHAGFDAAVREANGSPAGRRNGGAMLLALASEKALLTTLVRLASADRRLTLPGFCTRLPKSQCGLPFGSRLPLLRQRAKFKSW
jgi:hypothetical protein